MPKKYQPAGINMIPCKTKLGKFVRARRLQLNLRQVQVSRRVGETKNFCSQVEIGKRNRFGDEVIERLAEVMKCEPQEIRVLVPATCVIQPKTELGQFIQSRLDELKITRQELAQRLKRSNQHVYKLMCRGQTGINYQFLHPLAKALGVEPSSLTRFASSKYLGPTDSLLGKLVRQRRLELGLSITSLGELLGHSRQYVSQIEHGLVPLSHDDSVLERLAIAIQLDVTVLKAVRPHRNLKQVAADRNTLGGLLAGRRLELQLTQKEAAIRANVKERYVGLLEKNRSVPRHVINKVALALEYEIPPELKLQD